MSAQPARPDGPAGAENMTTLDAFVEKLAVTASEDQTTATFVIHDEDHTLGNVLRWVLARRPDVDQVSYAVPHPSEPKMNLRLQTRPGKTVNEVLRAALETLISMCDHVEDQYTASLEQHGLASA